MAAAAPGAPNPSASPQLRPSPSSRWKTAPCRGAAMYGDGVDLLYCPDCHRATQVVLDHGTGDTICTECALVLDDHYIGEGSEWRTFADDSGGQDRDPCRVGAASDPFLEARLDIVINHSTARNPQSKGGEAAGIQLPRMLVGTPSPDQLSLITAFRAIADMADRLGLVATIRDRAKEVYKKMEEAKGWPRGRNKDAFYAACLYIACRDMGMPRTYKEIATATAAGSESRKDICRMSTHIKKLLGEETGQVMDIGVVRAAHYLRRFCSLLGMSNQEIRTAQDAVQRLEECLDVRRNPESIAAAIIYMVVQRADVKKTVKDVSKATGVAEGTIKEAQKDLAPHTQLLFP